jgi:hypothetical protein
LWIAVDLFLVVFAGESVRVLMLRVGQEIFVSFVGDGGMFF